MKKRGGHATQPARLGHVELSALLKARKEEAMSADSAALRSVVHLPNISSSTHAAEASTARAPRPTDSSATLPLLTPRGRDSTHVNVVYSTAPKNVCVASRFHDTSFTTELRTTAAGARQLVATRVPPDFFVYKTGFDVTTADAPYAEYDFLVHRAKATDDFEHLTYRVPVLPSPRVADGPMTRQAQAPLSSIRGEVHYISQVADQAPTLACAAEKKLGLLTQPAAKTVAESMPTLRRSAFILHEAARLLAPFCLDLAKLLLVVEGRLDALPELIANSVCTLELERDGLQRALDTATASRNELRRKVEGLSATVERLQAAQVAAMSQQFVSEVQAHGIVPEVEKPAEPPRAMVTTEQINHLATHQSKLYAFSPERVVAGKRFAKHPVVTVDVAVDCTDLHFDLPMPAAAASDAARATTASSPTVSSPRLKFKGLTFVRAVHRVLDEEQVIARFKSQGLLRTSIAAEPEVTAKSPEPLTKRRSSMFRRKVSAALNTMRSSVKVESPNLASNDSSVNEKDSAVALGQIRRRASQRRSHSTVSMALAAPAVTGSAEGETPASPLLAESQIQFVPREHTDHSTQTEAAETADACVQAVEMDIDSKLRRRKVPAGLRTPSSSKIVVVTDPGASQSEHSRSRPPSKAGSEVPPHMELDVAAVAIERDGGMTPETPRDAHDPHDTADVGTNTDVVLVGADVVRLSFEDAVKVRCVQAFAADDSHLIYDDELSQTVRNHLAPSVMKKPAPPSKAHVAAGKEPRPQVASLPEDYMKLLGLKNADGARVRTLPWINATILEIVRHVEPFKTIAANKTLPELIVAHFRSKYGLGKMALGYALDFVGNLKLHCFGSLRAFLFTNWAGLGQYAGLPATPPFCTVESLGFYVYVVQAVARTGTHKTLKDLEGAELTLTWARVEAICDVILREVAVSYDNAASYELAKPGWLQVLLGTETIDKEFVGKLDAVQKSRGGSPLATITKRCQGAKVDGGAVYVDADALLFLLTCNYGRLRAKIDARAEALYAAASALLSDPEVAVTETGEYVEEAVPPPPYIAAKLAPWPLIIPSDEETATDEPEATTM
jgi:hypothetical protein